MSKTFTFAQAAVIAMAEVNVRGVNDALLAEWLNHRMPEVRAIAATEQRRRKAR